MTSEFEALVDDAATAGFSLAGHRRIVETVRTKDAGHLSLRERAKGYAHLQNVILLVQQNGEKKEEYASELSALFKLSSALRYSAALHEWMTQNRQECARQLRGETDFIKQDLRWASASPDERLELIRDLFRGVVKAHSRDGLDMKMPEILIDEKITGYGAFKTHTDDHGRPDANHIRIHFGQKLLENSNPDPALTIAYHEAVHMVTTQLALAVHTRQIGPDHFLYRDANLNLEKIKADAIASADIPENYFYDCDEELAYYHQDHFLNDLYDLDRNDPSALPSKRTIHAAEIPCPYSPCAAV